tara:strand:+ start:394 stop:552 length:159 start_codon:yes stop_codon:yes gene_type:complete
LQPYQLREVDRELFDEGCAAVLANLGGDVVAEEVKNALSGPVADEHFVIKHL